MEMFLEQNLFALISAAVSFISAWAVMKSKIDALEKRVDKIDELKIEANLVEIKTELNHIRVLIENSTKKI